MNLDANWGLSIDPRVYKELSKIPKDYADKIIGVLESLVFDPYAGDIEKIKDEQYVWRRRVGRYRIFYELYPNRKLVSVFHIEIRGSKTY